MGSMSIVHWMIVVGVVVLLFGKHKVSDLMGDVASGIKSFKKGMRDDEIGSPETVRQPSESPTPPTAAMSPVRSRAE